MKMFRTKILGTGSFVPDKVLSNDDIAKRVETNHQWIVERTGIHTRRISDPAKDELPSGMAAKAAMRALEMANLTPNDIDLILFSVTIPDMFFPNTASVLQEKLGMTNNCACLDVNAACSGWIYAYPMADALIKTGVYKHIMMVGCEMTSGFNNWDDRNTCILFGDGCGVTIMGRASESEDAQVYSTVLSSDSTKKDHLILPAGGAAKPIREEVLKNNEQWISMNGQEVFKAAVKTMAAHCEKLLQETGITLDQVKWFIPHQANLRIIEATANRLNFPMEKVAINVDRYANTSSASIPIALDDFVRDGKIQRGDIVLMAAFGAGLTSGAVLIKY